MSAGDSSSADFSSGRHLFEKGCFAEAQAVFQRLVNEDFSDADANFYLGRSAFEAGDYECAVAAFERLTMAYPEALRPRLELGRAYYALGVYSIAARCFEEVAGADPPPAVKANVEAYLAAIARKQEATARNQVHGSLSLGIGRDTNAAVSPSNSVIQTVYGPTTLQGGTANRIRTLVQTTSLSVSHNYRPAAEEFRWESTLFGYESWYPEEVDLDLQYLGLSTGPRWDTETSSIGLQGCAFRLYKDSLVFLDGVGVALPYAKLINDKVVATGIIRADHKAYHEGIDRRAIAASAEARVSCLLRRNRLDVYGRIEKESATYDTESFSRCTLGAKVEHSLGWGTFLSGICEWQSVSYEERDASLFNDKREDELRTVGVSLRKALGPVMWLELSSSWTRADSSLELYEYDRQVSVLSLTRSF